MNILSIVLGNTGLQYHRQTVPHIAMLADYHNEVKWSKCLVPEELTVELLKDFDIVQVLRECTHSRPKKEIKNDAGQTVLSMRDGEWLYELDNAFISKVKESGAKLVFDIDDNWILPKQHRLSLNFKAFDIERRTLNMLKQSDLVTTTTNHFAKHISTFTDRPIEIFPNTIDKRDPQWNKIKIDSSLVRFGWIGGVHHRKDIDLIEPAIKYFYKKHDNFQFALSFDYNNEYFKHEKIFSNDYSVTSGYKEYLDWQLKSCEVERVTTGTVTKNKSFVGDHYSYYQNYRRLWAKDVGQYGMMYNEIDVSLVPLRTDSFNQYKSELKLVEAGAMGKAAIVSRVKPYDHFPEECVYYADKKGDWYNAMRAMQDKAVRDRYAKNLSDYCEEYYNIETVTKKRYEVYSQLINK